MGTAMTLRGKRMEESDIMMTYCNSDPDIAPERERLDLVRTKLVCIAA